MMTCFGRRILATSNRTLRGTRCVACWGRRTAEPGSPRISRDQTISVLRIKRRRYRAICIVRIGRFTSVGLISVVRAVDGASQSQMARAVVSAGRRARTTRAARASLSVLKGLSRKMVLASLLRVHQRGARTSRSRRAGCVTAATIRAAAILATRAAATSTSANRTTAATAPSPFF